MTTVPATRWEHFLADEVATLRFAQRMAAHLPAGASPFVLYLQGDLGAGKTTLARGMLQALGETGSVRSPTYGLVSEYGTPDGPVLHLDLYRMRTPDELHNLGLADFMAGSRLWLVEWAELARGKGLPPADAVVRLEVQDQGRRLVIEPASSAGEKWATGLTAEAGS